MVKFYSICLFVLSVPLFILGNPQTVSLPGINPPIQSGGSVPENGVRGYVTTLEEMNNVWNESQAGTQPYANAVEGIENYANTGSGSVNPSTATPTYWPYGTISGAQSCSATLEPTFLGNGAPLIEAKALVYALLLSSNPTLANQYAANIVTQLNQLPSTTGYGSPTYSGANQCILNLSWYIPGFIIAADLINGYSGWTASDKLAFQTWLGGTIFTLLSWASDVRSNNWGSTSSNTAAMIADYLDGTSITLHDYQGTAFTEHTAYTTAKGRQLDRVDGQSYMDNTNCGSPGQGIRPDGGIPEELARGTTGCNGLWITQEDGSWTYTQTSLEGLILMAEWFLRRGDNTFFTNVSGTGHGSLKNAYLFILQNPNSGGLSWPWNKPNEDAELEILYRYYRDSLLATQLGIGGTRIIGTRSGQMLHFGTIFAGFAVGENPGLPPTVSPP